MGVAERLNAIIRNSTGGESAIARRAGIVGGWRENNNIILNQIKHENTRIDNLMRTMAQREASLFAMFARMEQAMMRSDSQMQSLFGMGGFQ
jgi:flagellar capping protein FliD